jgi:hypothetical protein
MESKKGKSGAKAPAQAPAGKKPAFPGAATPFAKKGSAKKPSSRPGSK